MAVVIVIEPHALLRLGILQHLAEVLPMSRLEGADYSALTRENTNPEETDLVLLSVPAGEELRQRISAVQRVYAPRCILLLSDSEIMPESWQTAFHTLPAEICGYLPRNASPDILSAAIKLVLVGGRCFQVPLSSTTATVEQPVAQTNKVLAADAHPALLSHDEQRGADTPGQDVPDSLTASESAMLKLTPRQYEVLVLLARGYPLKTVSRQLNISVATAKAHTETLYQRLDAHNRNEAVYAAISRGATLGWQQLEADKGAEQI